jgi:hypothetical protein
MRTIHQIFPFSPLPCPAEELSLANEAITSAKGELP